MSPLSVDLIGWQRIFFNNMAELTVLFAAKKQCESKCSFFFPSQDTVVVENIAFVGYKRRTFSSLFLLGAEYI